MRRETAGVAVLLLIGLSSGCCGGKCKEYSNNHKGPPVKGVVNYDVNLMGFVTKHSTDDYKYLKLDQAELNDLPLVREIPLNRKFESEHIAVFHVDELAGPSEYVAILGPTSNPKHGGVVIFEKGTIVSRISYGWIYLTGDEPRIKTEWVTGGACGCEIAMQIFRRTSDNVLVHRAYFIDGLSAYLDLDTGRLDFPETGMYVDVESSKTAGDFKKISEGDDDARNFKSMLDDIKGDTGL